MDFFHHAPELSLYYEDYGETLEAFRQRVSWSVRQTICHRMIKALATTESPVMDRGKILENYLQRKVTEISNSQMGWKRQKVSDDSQASTQDNCIGD